MSETNETTNEFKFRTKRERQRQTPYSRPQVCNRNSDTNETHFQLNPDLDNTNSLLSRIGRTVKTLVPNWLRNSTNLLNFNNNSDINSDNECVVNQEIHSIDNNIIGESFVAKNDNKISDRLPNDNVWQQSASSQLFTRLDTKWRPMSTTNDRLLTRTDAYLPLPSTSSTLYSSTETAEDVKESTHSLNRPEVMDPLEADDRSSSSSATASSTSGCSSLVPSHSDICRLGLPLEAIRRESAKAKSRDFGNNSTINKSLLASDPNDKSNAFINNLKNLNERKTNYILNNKSIKQFSVEKFMSSSTLIPRKSNFYDGKTVFGGSNVTRAARLAGTTPYNVSQRHHLAPVLRVSVNPSKRIIDASDPLSTSSQRIFEKLEKASTPLQDARRVPYSASTQLKDYFQSSNYKLRSSKRPKLAQTPVPSHAVIDHRFQPKRWELKAIDNKDDSKVSSTETTNQLINSCDTNRHSLIDSKINDSKDMKSNETFGGKMLRKDLRREERKIKTQSTNESQNESIDLLTNIQPLALPSGASLPKFNFGHSSSFEKQSNSSSNKALPTTTLTKVDVTEDEEPVFKFTEPELKKREKNANESVGEKISEPFVFSSPLGAITQKPSICAKNTIEKESNILRKSLERSNETTSGLTVDSIFSNNKLQNKTESKKTEAPNEKWICVCLSHNSSSDTRCKACNKERESLFKPPVPAVKSEVTPIASQTPITAPIAQKGFDWGNKFKAPTGSWSCPVCMINNNANDTKCMACEEPKPGVKNTTAKEADSWKCFYCKEANDMSKSVCISCDKIKTPIATKADLNKLYGGQAFKFGITAEKSDAKKDNLFDSIKSSEDQTNRSITNPSFFASTESTAQTLASIPISNTFVFGSTSFVETPKFTTDPQVTKPSDTTTSSASTEPLFKFGLPPALSKPTPDIKPMEKSSTSIVADIFGSTPKTNSPVLFQFGAQSSDTASTTTSSAEPIQSFVFGDQSKGQELSKSKKSVSFDLENKSDNKVNKTESTTPGFQFSKPSADDMPQMFKGFSQSANGSLFESIASESANTAVTTVSSAPNPSLAANKFGSIASETQNKSISSLFGLSTTTSSSMPSFSSPFSATNKFNTGLTSSTTSSATTTTGAENAAKNIFSLTPSPAIKAFDAKTSSNLSQTNQLDGTSATPTAPSTSSTSSSSQKSLVFGNLNTNLPSFSSQASAVTTKPNFSFNINANTGANSSTAGTDNKFGSTNKSLFGSNAGKGFTFGNTSLNSTQSQGFGFNIPTTTTISNTASNISFGLNSSNNSNNNNTINTTSNETTSGPKPATNQLFAFGSTSDQFSNPSSASEPLNTTKLNNPLNSSQFSFGVTPNASTGQTNSSNLFGNAINAGQNSLSFSNQSSGLPAPQTSSAAFTFGGFGSTQPMPSVPQIQSQPQQQPQQPLAAPQFNFSQQPSFDFASMTNTGAQPGAPVFQFSAEPTPQTGVNRITKKAKRRLNPT